MKKNEQSTGNTEIVWLASYPKSGNTWFRAFLTALLGDGQLDINDMKTDGIYSARNIYDDATDLDSTYLYDSEVKLILPEVYRHQVTRFKKELLFMKIHDAYTVNKAGQPIVPQEPTRCALYFIRNPLDVAASFAHHSGTSIDETIFTMNNPKGVIAKQTGNYNVNNQFQQLLLSWSEHVKSWTAPGLPFPVMVIKYEDMLSDGLNTFFKAVEFMGLSKSREHVQRALLESQFERLKEQESKSGFNEKNRKSSSFFRNGRSDGWKEELSFAQIQSIIHHHGDVMTKFGYPGAFAATGK